MEGKVWTSPSQARKALGVCSATLRNWDRRGLIPTLRTPTGYRLYDVSGFQEKQKETQSGSKAQTQTTTSPPTKQRYIYARVSSPKQKADLERQVESLRTLYPEHAVVTDIGSGINFQRRGLQKLLQLSSTGLVEQVVCSHRDRMCRFAFELLEYVFGLHGTRLLVHHQEDSTNLDNELSSDILAINTVFICRMQGRRAAENRRRRRSEPSVDHEQIEGVLQLPTASDIEEMDRLL